MIGSKTAGVTPETSTLWTIGHSTRSLEEFLELLAAWEIGMLVDVRRFPASRRYPHFNDTNLAASLDTSGIHYRHLKDLGGRRPTRPDSINLGWRNAGFRGYADYMQTKDFWDGLEELTAYGKKQRAALMCAEAVPWRCHRLLISDALLTKGWTIDHILTTTVSNPHTLTSFAKPTGNGLFYPKALEFESTPKLF